MVFLFPRVIEFVLYVFDSSFQSLKLPELASADPGDEINCTSFATPKQPWWGLKRLFNTPVATPEKELNTEPPVKTTINTY
jgi:hypothetical protein